MLSKIIFGIILFIIAIFLWEITPLRRYYLLMKGKSIGAKTRMKIHLQVGLFRKFRWIFRTAFDFSLFWMIFEWKDGVILGYIKVWWNDCLQWLQTVKEIWITLLGRGGAFLIYLTPFGRRLASNPSIRYCLIVGTICVGIAFIIYIISLKDEVGNVANFIFSSIGAMCMWYACYGISLLVAKIPIYFQVLAAIAMILASIVLFLIFGILIAIIEDFLF